MTVFFRNPVGLNALGGDRVGGKPYIDVILGIMSYIILSNALISAPFSRKIPKYVLITSMFTSIAGAMAIFIPSIAGKLAPFYSTFGSGLTSPDDLNTEFDINNKRFFGCFKR